jgi:integrase
MNTVNAASKEESDLIYSLLVKKYKPIYADIWKIGINTALRITDLLSIKFDNLDLANQELRLIERKTGKKRIIRLNRLVIDIIKKRRANHPFHQYLFEVDCNRAKGKPISRETVSRAFKEASNLIGLQLNTHSMRKSRGKAMFDAGVPVEMITKVLNHSTTSVTLRYIGITNEQVQKTYDDFEL